MDQQPCFCTGRRFGVRNEGSAQSAWKRVRWGTVPRRDAALSPVSVETTRPQRPQTPEMQARSRPLDQK